MKFIFIVAFFVTLSFSASAQWWHVSLKKHQRSPQLAQVTDHSIKYLPIAALSKGGKIHPYIFTNSTDYYLELQEAAVMKTAQHNMRFREYPTASYNFSDLAKLYIKEQRYSEAKWFLLQSNFISRQQNDDKHTIANLMDLAMVKANMGDIPQAQEDLTEARLMAASHGWAANVADIDKESKSILGVISTPKADLRYAADAIIINKKATDKKSD